MTIIGDDEYVRIWDEGYETGWNDHKELIHGLMYGKERAQEVRNGKEKEATTEETKQAESPRAGEESTGENEGGQQVLPTQGVQR